MLFYCPPLRLYGAGTYDSWEEANDAIDAKEARGEEVEWVEVDLPELEKKSRVVYVDNKATPKEVIKM